MLPKVLERVMRLKLTKSEVKRMGMLTLSCRSTGEARMRIENAQVIRHVRSCSPSEFQILFACDSGSLHLPLPHAQQKAGKRFVTREQHYSLRGFSSASRMPSLTKSSGFGRCWSLCSRLSARMCFSRAFWFACNAGAVDVGDRILPINASERAWAI